MLTPEDIRSMVAAALKHADMPKAPVHKERRP